MLFLGTVAYTGPLTGFTVHKLHYIRLAPSLLPSLHTHVDM